jgi:hypothetical protein
MPLTAEELLDLDDLRKPTKLAVRAWKRDVWLLDPTADVRDDWEIFCAANANKRASWRAKMASLLVCDEDGKRLFSDGDIPRLGKKSAAALQEIWTVGTKLMTVTDKEIEELEKN